MDLRAVLTTLRRSWPLLVVPLVVGVVGAVAALAVQTPRYESTANVYVSVGNTANAGDLSQANDFAQSAAANFAALAEQPYVLHAVRQQLGLVLTSDQIADEMTTSVQEGTSIITIAVLDPDAARAARIADATARQLATAVSVLNPSAADGTQNVRVTVVRTASVAQSASVPNRPLGLALGLLGGLLLGVVLVILRELLDTRVRTAGDLQALTAAPVVGEIPRTSAVDRRPLVMVDDRGGAAAEGFRRLQLNLEYLRAPDGAVVVGIASAVPAEGKSTVAANLALALAAAGHRVALVDADLRRPRQHAIFGLDDAVGLTEVLIGKADLFDVVQPWGSGDHRIAVVPAGSVPPNPGELLQSPRLRAVLDRLVEEADVVVVDGPPLLTVADSSVLARTVDAVLLVGSLRRSHRTQVVRARAALDAVGARVLGSVATMTRLTRSDADAYQRYSRTVQDRSSQEPAVEEPVAEEPAAEEVASPAAGPAARRRDRASIRREARRQRSRAAEPLGLEALLDDGQEVPESGAARADDAPRSAEKPVAGRPATMRQLVIDEPAPVAAAEAAGSATDGQGAGLASRPVRVPSTAEVDARTLRSAKRSMSAEELQILRGFTTSRPGADRF